MDGIDRRRGWWVRTVELLDGWADLDRRVVHRDGGTEPLTGREAALLELLSRRAGEDCPRGLLLQEVWGLRPDTATRTIDATVRRLRRKIEPRPGTPQLLLTVHGVGYRWAPSPTAPSPEPGIGRVAAPLAHIPRDDHPLVGRDGDVAALLQILSTSAVQLVGPGGVGKSALARATARRWSAQQARPAWWIPLEGVSDLDEARWRVVEGLGIAAGCDAAASLQRSVERLGHALLVLDGTDSLSDEAFASLVRPLDARVLVTVRRRRDGAPAHRVVPLPTPMGARLLADHLERLGIDPAAEAEALETVARRLGGLPLTLSLAAPRIRLLGAQVMAAHLDREQPTPERLEAWWSELSPPQTRALAVLSLLPERFELSLAEAALGGEALDRLADLVDASWLSSSDHGGRRVFLWLPPLRALARRHLSARDGRDALQRVAVALAEQVGARLDHRYGPHSAADAAWLRRHRKALEIAAAAVPHRALWVAIGHVRRALGDGDGAEAAWEQVDGATGSVLRGLPAPVGADPVSAAAAAMAVAIREGMREPARPAASGLLRLADDAGDHRAVYEACFVLAHIEATRGNWEAAASVRRRGLAAATSPYVAARLRMVPFPLPREDMVDLDTVDAIVEAARLALDRRLELQALSSGATTALERQEVTRATEWAEAAQQLLWTVDLPTVRAGAAGNLGLVFRELGDQRRAEACLDRVWRDAPEHNVVQYRALAGLGLASTFLDAGHLGRARAMLDEMSVYAEDPRVELRAGYLRCLCDALDGSATGEVEPVLRSLLARSEDLASPSDVGRCALWLAALDPPDASDLLRAAEETFAATGESELHAVHDLLFQRGERIMTRPALDPGRFSSQVRLIRRLRVLSSDDPHGSSVASGG